mgnify:FL=1
MKTAKLLALGLCAIVITSTFAGEKSETAVLAAGCFWCLEAIFEQQPGVINVDPGYAGGTMLNPTYENHGHGADSHAESIEITFDPEKTSFEKLLDVYWRSFDPTEGRGVAPDFGPSYRPIVFYLTPGQKKTAEASKAALQKTLDKPVAVEIKALDKFWPAEEYHHDYAEKNPNSPYVRSVTYERMDRVGAEHP